MSSTSSPASRPLEGAVTPREELCSTGHPSNYSRRCRKRRGCRCRKRGVPPSVADKQPRQRCATAPRPRRAAEPCPRATPGHRHPEQHCHHPWCPQRSQACLCVGLTQSSHGPGIICAPSPRALPGHTRCRMGCCSPSESQESSRGGMQLPLKAVKDPSP